MTNLEIKQIVGNTPNMSLEQANKITDFIEQNNIKNILELGFAHGVSTTYMAAALKRINNGGRITTIDNFSAKRRNPNIETFLESIDELARVNIYYEPTSYVWRLMKFLEEDTTPRFDLCYLDGAHSWFVDGFAFFLVDKLLKAGGWIIFDDMYWTYAISPTMKDTEFVKNMPEEERTQPQVKKIFDLLVKTHPNYSNFKVFSDKQWCMAQKISSEKKIEILEYDYFNSEDNIQLSKKISKLYNQIEKLKNNGNKFLIYGYGSMAKIIESLMPKQITGFIDLNYAKLNNEKVFSIENGLKKDFDFILISILGREEEVINSLINEYSIQKDKIIKLI